MEAAADPTADRDSRHDIKTRHPLALARAVALAAVLASLAGCSSTGAPASASAAPTGAASGLASLAPVSTPLPSVSAAASAGTTIDGAGDVTPSYLDIVAMRAGAEAGSLTLGLDLAAAVPAGSPAVGQLAYHFYLDVDGDGAWDYTAALKLVPEGGFRPSLVGRGSTPPLEGPAFPGTANLAGSTISLMLRLDAIGCPSSVGVRADSQQTKAGATAGDQVPDAPDAWIPVATGCQPAGS